MKNILLINDLAGVGKVALSAMIPLLSALRHRIHNLPTALVSSNLDYGDFTILDASDYMEKAMACYDRLGFEFDAVSTGFLLSQEQEQLVKEFCIRKKKAGASIYVDPIMGDDGHLYNGIGMDTVAYMRDIMGIADVAMPNFTEACFLAGCYEGRDSLNVEETKDLGRKLLLSGAGHIVITSMVLEHKPCTLIVAPDKDFEVLPYDLIPVRYAGTGDIFSAAFIASHQNGDDVKTAARKAMQCVEYAISKEGLLGDSKLGVNLELYLEDMRRICEDERLTV